MTREISAEAKDALDRAQRENLLREQLEAIQKELGESDGKAAEIRSCARKSPARKRRCKLNRKR